MSGPRLEGGSFRDRNARVFYADGRVLRGLGSEALESWRALAATAFFEESVGDGLLVQTRELDFEQVDPELTESWAGVLEHEPVPFVSYPYEWCFGMLRDAALLQLELLERALGEGLVLKDSTPYNVQWFGTRPAFIDIASFEPLAPGAPWAGYRQFCEMFLYPLMLRAYKKAPFQPWLRGALDGIRPSEFRGLISWRDLLRAGVLKHVVLHAAAEARFSDTSMNIASAMKDAGFSAELIQTNVRSLRRVVDKLAIEPESSAWSEYEKCGHYEDSDAEAKADFVRRVAGAGQRGQVWDLGCNVGIFSRIAAEHADSVVAMDADAPTIELLYRRLRQEGEERIHPLVMNLVDPSPDRGWRGVERKSLPARGRPDLVLCLALIHHVVIGSNVRMEEFIAWLAELGGELVIEFVDKADPMVERLLRNKVDNYEDYDPAVFEAELERRFEIVDRLQLSSGTRTLYFGRNRRGA